MKKKEKRARIMEELNRRGILSPEQAKKINVIKSTLNKIDPHLADQIADKEPYQLSLEEFKSAFAKSALELTGFESVSAPQRLLVSSYIQTIIKAVQEDKNDVHLEGLRLIGFQVKYFKMVRKYCRARKIDL